MKSELFTNVMCIKRRLLMAFSSRLGGRMMNCIALLAWGNGRKALDGWYQCYCLCELLFVFYEPQRI